MADTYYYNNKIAELQILSEEYSIYFHMALSTKKQQNIQRKIHNYKKLFKFSLMVVAIEVLIIVFLVFKNCL